MQFNDTSTDTGIVQDIYWLTGTNTTSYPLKDVARNVNRWYFKAIVALIQSNRDWQFDDTNYTTYPEATTTLVADQSDYILPTNLLKLHRVFVKNSAGNYEPCTPIDAGSSREDLDEVYETSAMPIHYDVVGDSIFLYPAPASASVTTTAGLKILYSRDFDAFTYQDTTQEPGIPEAFHRILSFGGAYDWYTARGDMTRASGFRSEVEALLGELRAFNRDKNTEVVDVISSNHNTRIVR